MKIMKGMLQTGVLVLFISVSLLGEEAYAGPGESQKLYFGIEINGVLCGYSEISLSPLVQDGKTMTLLKQNTFAMLSALGSQFNTDLKLTYHIDPVTGRFSYHDSDITQGPTKLGSVISVTGDTARFTSTPGNREVKIPLPPEVVFENTLSFPHLLRDFVQQKLDQKTYEILEVRDAEVQKSTYTRVGTEKLELAGSTYNALILDKLNQKTGLKVRMWLDLESGYLLKATAPGNRISYRADPSVVNRIKMADVDASILAKANVTIADVQAISYMKVKATLEPSGLWVTQEGLNVPGQRFAGTINDNLIEGVFEIEHKRYDGAGAPAFPPDFGKDQSVKKYLEAEEFIESDDPVLVTKAQELTKGSKDSWEAARRLNKWVAENIHYAIPGGATARKTYDLKAGECGAHAILLATFCRAVGIPARVVWGCMYAPNYGGVFGQHGWNEIYMGPAGWIPVDATAAEIDCVDSGHIRIGVLQSLVTALNPRKMEVLDYRAGSARMGQAPEGASDKYQAYVGEYTNPANKSVMKVFVQGGALALDVPGKVVLALNDPDEKGVWRCKLASQLFLKFDKDGSGKVVEMQLHQVIPLPRRSGPPEENGGVPERLRPYLGAYLLAARQAEFTVLHQDNGLAVYDPLEKKTVRLRLPDNEGRWVDEFDKNAVSFDRDGQGNITAMNIDSVTRLRR
ncbi:MAG: transglutaminase domain-containing protein [Planctomycetes bacterium]|nr:transglutaminase domain-containing protein [Planctomycetota bacterium]